MEESATYYLVLLILAAVVVILLSRGLIFAFSKVETGLESPLCEDDIFLYCQGLIEWNTECGSLPDCSKIPKLPIPPSIPEPPEPSEPPPPSGECNSKCKDQEYASGTCRSSRLYVDGKDIKAGDQVVQLAGAAFGPMWNIELSTPGSIQAKEKNIQNMKEADANLVFLTINLELWSNPDYSDQYKQNVEAWIEWLKEYDMFFIIKLHCSRYEYDVFSDAGTNWKIAEYEPQRSQATDMYVEMANKWKNLPNFVGISLLNEPAGWPVEDEKWDVVTEFYLDAIDAIREVDPECIIFVQAPYRPSGYPKEWVNRGFLQREGVVLEFHQYYYHRLQSGIEEWALIYRDEGPEAGREAYEQWLVENIISVRDEYDIPIFSGEFGVHLDPDLVEPVPDPIQVYWEEQHTDKMQLFNNYKIHYSQWRVYNRQGTSHNFAMCTSDGLNFNIVGQNWAANLPSDLIRPSDLEGECEDGETPVEDGCDAGFSCCCSGISNNGDEILVYSTDFEDVTWKVGDGNADFSQLDLGDIPNHFVFQGDGGAKAWIEEGTFCHSGSKCIGMELFDITKSRRNAFALLNAHEWLGDEYTVEAWYYLPTDWKLVDSSWFTIHAPMTSYPTEQSGGAYQPYYEIMISNKGPIFLFYRNLKSHTHVIKWASDFSIPKGRWFKIKVYVLRHLTDGIIKTWIDGTKVFDETGLTTRSGNELTDKGYFITPAKIYHDTAEHLPHKLWVDDLKIWTGK